MVRAFLLLAMGGAEPPSPAPSPAPCRLLHAREFGTPPATPHGDPPGDPPLQRLRRKEQLMAVARQVTSHYQLLQSSSGCPPTPQHPPDDPSSSQDPPGGIFPLPPGDPFPEGLTVIWGSFVTFLLVFICHPQENLFLAQITLRRLAPSLRCLLGADVLLRPELLDLLLDQLLPQGRVMFLSHRFLQVVDEEIRVKMIAWNQPRGGSG